MEILGLQVDLTVKVTLLLILVDFMTCHTSPDNHYKIINEIELEGNLNTYAGCLCGDSTNKCPVNEINFYRYIKPTEDGHLYIGAMNYLFKLDASNLTCLKSKNLKPDTYTNYQCSIQGNDNLTDCQNHIRVVMETTNEEGQTQLFVCGTGAYKPTNYTLELTDLNDTGTADASGMCPYDPFDNATAIQIDNGNPGGRSAMYFGTYSDFNKNFPTFNRPRYTVGPTIYSAKDTDNEDEKWLNSPQFVGSFDMGNQVYTFFREESLEYIGEPNSSPKIYSRVAKVCKKDMGGISKKQWLSFQKAKLNCSIGGTSQYSFDDIYDVAQSDDGLFYALFYKMGGMHSSSAICVYNKEEIVRVFEGHFQQKSSSGMWEKVSPDPVPRLDNCTLHDTNPGAFNGQTLRLLLMNDVVQPLHGQPIFSSDNGVQLMRLVVGETKNNSRNLYVASSDGEIHDIFVKTGTTGSLAEKWAKIIVKENLVYQPFGVNKYPIWTMLKQVDALIMGTDRAVKKMDLNVCSKITEIDTCVYNTLCEWTDCDKACHFAKTIKKREIDTTSTCEVCNHDLVSVNTPLNNTLIDLSVLTAVERKDLMAIEGVYFTLEINYPMTVHDVQWSLNNTKINIYNDKFAWTSRGDLIVKNVTISDSGNYEARDSTDTKVAEYKVNITPSEDTNKIVEIWKQQFVEWASAFNKWKGCANDYLDSCPGNN